MTKAEKFFSDMKNKKIAFIGVGVSHTDLIKLFCAKGLDVTVCDKKTAEQMKEDNYPKEGLSFIAHLKGLFGQRLWFYRKTTGYTDKLKISAACVGCGLCSRECPMGNIRIEENRAVAGDRCTMCYRCISLCPKQAITLLGDEVYEQCRYEKYKS